MQTSIYAGVVSRQRAAMQSKTTIPLLTTGGLVLLIAAWFGFKTLQHRNLLNNGHQFALTASENILASWNSDFFRQISSEELISSFVVMVLN